MGLYNTKMKTFAIIVLLAAVKTLNSFAGIRFNIPGDNFNIPNQGRQTHYPEDNIPELKFCRPEAPCQYGEGDCTRHGDEGCDSDLVCGVNNCGDFVPNGWKLLRSTCWSFYFQRREGAKTVDVLVSDSGRLGETEKESADSQ